MSPDPNAAPPPSPGRARAGLLVLLELLPYVLVGLGAGLWSLPAGFLVPGLLWWYADHRAPAPPPPPALPPRGPRGSEP